MYKINFLIILLFLHICCLQSTTTFAECSVFADSSNDWAVEVVEYVVGNNPKLGYYDGKPYTNPVAALGPAARETAGLDNPMPVEIHYPAWTPNELVSIGDGGWLTVKMGKKVYNEQEPIHPYDMDLIVFGNDIFWSSDGPPYHGPWYAGDSEGGEIWVSQDESNWFYATDKCPADSLLPTQSKNLDGTPTDYLYPPNPILLMTNWYDGDWYKSNSIIAYDGSGGGMPIDLSDLEDEYGTPTNLPWILYVKIFDTDDPGTGINTEIDAIAAVKDLPEPIFIFYFLFIIYYLLTFKN